MFFKFLSLISVMGFPPMDSFIFLVSAGNLENEEVLFGLVGYASILLWEKERLRNISKIYFISLLSLRYIGEKVNHQ
ncbi:hypothetical protein L2E82_19292 [Cichorium intybus]|uniref:Uncharacterized protein n=1 Tax=Cichorium intybus TaxID=13427 RepID=A0ACB9FBT7_CICIN|nr:hypothetical protein L2E82_19292 [Cichorium intybus]